MRHARDNDALLQVEYLTWPSTMGKAILARTVKTSSPMDRTPTDTNISASAGMYSNISPMEVGINPGMTKPMVFSIQISAMANTHATFNNTRR